MKKKKLTAKQIEALRLVGRQMSTLCYNLSQDELPPDSKYWPIYRDIMWELAQEWNRAEELLGLLLRIVREAKP